MSDMSAAEGLLREIRDHARELYAKESGFDSEDLRYFLLNTNDKTKIHLEGVDRRREVAKRRIQEPPES